MPSHHSFIPQFVLVGVIFLLAACGSGKNNRDVPAALAAHLQSANQAQIQAAAHWDTLILGESVNCGQGLVMPPSFNLTQSEAERHPEAVLVRDHLNFSIELLTQSAQVWDTICSNPSSIVPPQEANSGYLAASNARIEIDLAQAAYNAWNP